MTPARQGAIAALQELHIALLKEQAAAEDSFKPGLDGLDVVLSYVSLALYALVKDQNWLEDQIKTGGLQEGQAN